MIEQAKATSDTDSASCKGMKCLVWIGMSP